MACWKAAAAPEAAIGWPALEERLQEARQGLLQRTRLDQLLEERQALCAPSPYSSSEANKLQPLPRPPKVAHAP